MLVILAGSLLDHRLGLDRLCKAPAPVDHELSWFHVSGDTYHPIHSMAIGLLG